MEDPRLPLRSGEPADGIALSSRPRGWLGTEWDHLLHRLPQAFVRQVSRGKQLARRRVRDLWITPGQCNAEVYDQEVCRPALRVRMFDPEVWEQIFDLLHQNLGWLASLLEGTMPRDLAPSLAQRGIHLIPQRESELEGDCSCGDYHMPCAHLVALRVVLADALDGEPFLLLTLRGRNREQILAALRKRWGDTSPNLGYREPQDEEAELILPWTGQDAELDSMRFSFRPAEISAAGLKSLGPPPGEDNLLEALEPLYLAGAEAALELALLEAPKLEPRPRKRPVPAVVPDQPEPEGELEASGAAAPLAPAAATTPVAQPPPLGMVETTAIHLTEPSGPPTAPPQPELDMTLDLTERIAAALHTAGAAKTAELAEMLRLDQKVIRDELTLMEQLGLVYRTGITRGTVWHLA
jgi:uncharacterized Zn finger protein